MDDAVRELITQSVISSVSSFINYSSASSLSFIDSRKSKFEKLKQLSSFNAEFYPHDVNLLTRFFKNKNLFEVFMNFIKSGEGQNFIRHLVAVNLQKNKKNHIENCKFEFISLVLLTGCLDENETKNIEGLFYQLDDKIVEILDKIKKCDVISASDIEQLKCQSIIINQILSIQRNIDMLNYQEIDIKEIKKFELKYRCQVHQRHGYITPPHLDKAQKAPIDKLYVTPNFIPSSIKNAEHQNPLTYDDFVRELYRVVLLGNPGAGKSTLANKLCHDLSKPTNPITNDGLVITPVIVILREYANEKKNKGISVMQYIEQRSNSHYQVEAPKHAFEYMILNGKAVVIFDGLDELLNTSYRKEISDDVQSFCNLYPTVPVLVTSREVGYEQAPLDHSIFNEFRLSPFDDEQVLSYAKKWFMVDGEIDDKAGQSKAEAFFNESQSVFDLRSNPLLLSLMCNLYRGENYIPKNRPDVYEKCALMLFERWDKGRGIKVDLPFEEHIKPSMNHIAYWLYSENGSNAVAAESKLIQRTSQYLIGKRFEDEDEAKFAAVQFIEFCSGRAWVFTDVGTTESGERLFQFTHRTFLEYFTALDIIRNNPTPKQLITFLIDRIKAVEWDVVCQLSFQILNKNVEGASGKLFELLFDCKQSSSSKQWQSIVTFANRCLSFLVPPPAITRRLVKYTLQQCCSITSSKKSILTSLWRNALVELMNATHENLGPISNELGTTIEESLKSNDKSATIMIEILIEIETVVRDFSPISNSRQNEAFWNNFREALFQKHKTLILNGSSNDLNNSIRLFFKDEFTLNELIANHGLSSIYKRGNFYLSDNISYIPPVLGAILTVVKSTMREEDDNGQIAYRDRRKQLIELGQNVIQSELPIEFHMDHNIDIRDLFHTRRYNPKEYEAETFIVKSNGNILFGVFIALAISIELDTKHKLLTMIESNASVLTQIFKDIFKHRYGGNFTYEAKNLISLIDFDHNQLNFINKWARKEVSIVKPIRTCKGKDSKKPGTRNQENEENEENEG